MKEEYYQIGEVSRITGISKDTLHFYTKIGLVTPDYINPENHYHYYSRWNMYQLDIITTCRNLKIPLEKVKEIISSRDNEKVVKLLMEYRSEALRLSQYYRQVADDISWYYEENENIKLQASDDKVHMAYFEPETVIVGNQKREDSSYHANLQDVINQEFQTTNFVRRKYGYFLDTERFYSNKLRKYREYVKLPDGDYSSIAHIKSSLFIIVLRQIVLLVPLAWVFHFIGLNAVWWTFPVTEIIASTTGILIIMILHKQDSALRI